MHLNDKDSFKLWKMGLTSAKVNRDGSLGSTFNGGEYSETAKLYYYVTEA